MSIMLKKAGMLFVSFMEFVKTKITSHNFCESHQGIIRFKNENYVLDLLKNE